MLRQRREFQFEEGGKTASFFYLKEFGSFYFHGADGTMEYMCDEVAIAYDRETFVVFYHGSEADVQTRARKTRAKYAEVAKKFHDPMFDRMADGVVVISAKEWDLNELNRILATTGYLKRFLEKKGLIHAGA